MTSCRKPFWRRRSRWTRVSSWDWNTRRPFFWRSRNAVRDAASFSLGAATSVCLQAFDAVQIQAYHAARVQAKDVVHSQANAAVRPQANPVKLLIMKFLPGKHGARTRTEVVRNLLCQHRPEAPISVARFLTSHRVNYPRKMFIRWIPPSFIPLACLLLARSAPYKRPGTLPILTNNARLESLSRIAPVYTTAGSILRPASVRDGHIAAKRRTWFVTATTAPPSNRRHYCPSVGPCRTQP